ncbi:hypothetical protein DRN97_04215 [Methanosarcinales archaeon]|nr:MAG: hypothetical protein DRN97_04215 [Methanosarcinales archaeon]
MVRAGETYELENIKVRIVEVISYMGYKRRRHLLIGYRIIDGSYQSPIAHFWMRETEDIRRKIEEIVKYYLDIKKSMALP